LRLRLRCPGLRDQLAFHTTPERSSDVANGVPGSIGFVDASASPDL
jgi:hypothetical protein